ncbi:MAG: hypothetical protein COA94_03815 [Rickettsiales bacterium]|nr:MAG: hypothetical protein COA94_03815 [Rickettsiales bacterium]
MFLGFGIDAIIVVGFLIATLVVGLGHGRSITTIKGYALGGRNFSTGALVATLVATWIGGSGFTINLSKTYSSGFLYIVPSFGMTLSFLIMAYLFVPRMGEFLGVTSIAEAMGDLYGKHIRIITAVTGVMSEAGFVAVQFKVFGNLASYFLDLSPMTGIVAAAAIITTYSAFGGIRAVTFTDILQLFTFGFAIPIIGVMVWNHAYYDGVSLANSIQDNRFSLEFILSKQNPDLGSMIALMCYFALPGLKPAIFQRISMGSSVKQVQKAFIISAVIVMFITFASQWIPFLLFNIDSTLEPSELLSYMIENYTYIGFKGLVIAGIIAMTMSTADSNINSSAVLFANDICKPLNVGQNRELLISKLFSIALGIGGIVLAVSTKDLLDVVLTANSFYMPVVTVPVMLTILGFRSSTKSVLIGMGAGFGTVVIWRLLSIQADCIAFSMLVNLIFLIGSHYVLKQKGGWVGIKGQAALDALREEKMEEQQKRAQKLADDKGFVDACQKHCPKDEMSFVGLGIYLIIYTMTTIYSTTEALKHSNQMILIIYQIMMVSGVVLAMYPIWPRGVARKTRETIAQVLWPMIIAYMLVMFNLFFVMVSNFSPLQFAVFTLNLVIVVVLLGWRIGGIAIVFGSLFAMPLYKEYGAETNFDVAIGSPAFVLIYILLLVGATIVLFLKPKQEKLEQTEEKVGVLSGEVTSLDNKVVGLNEKVVHYSERTSDQAKEIERLGATAQKILNNVNHELRLPVGNVMNFAEMMRDGLGKFSDKQLKMISEEVYENSNRLSTMILNMLDLATLNAKKIELKKVKTNFSELVQERVESCRKIYVGDKPLEFKLNIEPNVMAVIDANYIRQTIDNLVINAISFSDKGVIIIDVVKQDGFASFTIQDQGLGIPKNEIYDIFTPFKMGSNTESKAEGRGVGLALCKAAVSAHGGEVTAESNGKGAMFEVMLPL